MHYGSLDFLIDDQGFKNRRSPYVPFPLAFGQPVPRRYATKSWLPLALFRYLLDVRGDAQVLPLSVGFHLREIILFHETDGVAAEQ